MGAVILFDLALRGPVDEALAEELSGSTRIADGRRVFAEVIRDCPRRITYAGTGASGVTSSRMRYGPKGTSSF
jgi:hypothetical protein